MALQNFNIPAAKTDLLGFINKSYNVAELSNNIRDLTSSFGQEDLDDYLDKFLAVFYCVTEHIEDLEWKHINYYFDVLKKVWSQAQTKLDIYFKNKSFDRQEILNSTKVVLYITNEFIYACDKKINANSVGKTKKKTKKQISSIADLHYSKWSNIKTKVLFFMYSMSNFPLSTLFDPPLPEEQFTDLMSDSCYSTLKDTDLLKASGVREVVFQILGNLIKHYNHSNAFIIKFVHVIKKSEPNLQLPIALGVVQLKQEYKLNSLIVNITKEILLMIENEKSNDAVELKNFMNFLTELSPHEPRSMIPVASLLEGVENFELATIRSCYCSIISDILFKELNTSEISVEDKKLQDMYLMDLYEMIHDVSAIIRSKVLQIFKKLLKENCMPRCWQTKVMQRSVGRLADRATMVRKNCIVLLKEFLSHKPIDVPLDLKMLNDKLNEAVDNLSSLHLEAASNGNSGNTDLWNTRKTNFVSFLKNAFATEASIETYESMELDDEQDPQTLVNHIVKNYNEEKFDEVLKYTIFMERMVADGATESRKKLSLEDLPKHFYFVINNLICKSMSQNMTNADGNSGLQELKTRIREQEQLVELLQDSLQYYEVISSAIPSIQQMLYSKAVNDTNEAIDFFASAVYLGIDAAYDGILHLLYLLVTAKENKNIVYKTLTRICLEDGEVESRRSQSVQAVKKVTFLMEKMRPAHQSSLLLLIKYWLKEDLFTSPMIQVCWERVTRKLEDTTDVECSACLIILSLVALQKPNVVYKNLNVVETVLLEDFANKGVNFAIYVFELLRSMWASTESISSSTVVMAPRLPKNSDLFRKVASILMHYFNMESAGFRRLCKAGIAVIYAGCDVPNEIVHSLVSEMIPSDEDLSKTIKAQKLSRILYCVSEIALQHLAYLDVAVYSKLKDRKENPKNVNSSRLHSASKSLRTPNTSKTDNDREPDEDDEQKLWAATEDTEANYIYDLCEKELLEPPSSLSYIYAYVVDIITRKDAFDDRCVQLDATNALMAFMLISTDACRKNMEILMRQLKFCKYPDIKCNIIVGLADLLARFPNEVAPWESYLFERLSDTNMDVKKVTLKFCCQLILTNAIRPKSHISDIALILVDEDKVMRNLAVHFFKEISAKELQLYNALPDIISKLTNPALDIVETKFQIIMKIILKFIHKDRHMEGLVVKLCLRLQITTDAKQLRNLAYCLSLINHTEKSVQALIDNYQSYKEKLNVPEILKIYKDIVNLGNKASAKPTMKTLCTELDNLIESTFEISEGQENGEAQPTRQQSKKQHNPKSSRRQRIARDDSSSSSDDVFAKPSTTSDKNTNPSRRSARPTKNRTTSIIEDSSSDENESDSRNAKKVRS